MNPYCYGTAHDCSTISDETCTAHAEGCSLAWNVCSGANFECSTWNGNEPVCEGAGCTFTSTCSGSILNSNCNQLPVSICTATNCINQILNPSIILRDNFNTTTQANISKFDNDIVINLEGDGMVILRNQTGIGTIQAHFITGSKVANNNTNYLKKLDNYKTWIYKNGSINYSAHYAYTTREVLDKQWIDKNFNIQNSFKKVDGLDVEERIVACEGSLIQIKDCIAKWDGKKETLQNCIGSLG